MRREDMFDYAPRLEGCSTDEPTLREILFAYYHLGLSDRDLANRYTDEYIGKVEDALEAD